MPARLLSRLLIACFFATLPVAAQMTEEPTALPDFGDISGSLMTPAQEERLGQEFMRYVRATQHVVKDPLLTAYIQDVGDSLVARSDAPGRNFNFFLVDDPEINAFAGPGGRIGVHTGLLLTTQSESELAAVMAHEIAHVTQNHLFRAWHATEQMAPAAAALLIAAALLGAAGGGGDAALAVAAGGQAALIQRQINFTRHNEQEADRIGIQVLAETGFDPHAMASFFGRMGKANRTGATEVPEFLRTHPVTTNRIADAQGRANQYRYRQPHDDMRYYLAKAALEVERAESPLAVAGSFQARINDGRYQRLTAEYYGLALANLKAERYQQAEQALHAIDRKFHDLPELVEVRARLALAHGRPDQADALLSDALLLLPHNRALALALGRTKLETGQYRQAYDQLSALIDQQPDDAEVRKQLATAAGKLGKIAEGHEQLAEFHYLTGDTRAAIQQLQQALKQPGLPYFQEARLTARLRSLEQQLARIEEL